MGATDVVTRRPREEPGVRHVQAGQKWMGGHESLLRLWNHQQGLTCESLWTAPNFLHSEKSCKFFEIESIVNLGKVV